MKRNHVLWNVFVLTVAVLFGSVATSVAGVIGGMITYNGVYADSSAPLKVAAFEKQGDTMPVCAMDLGSVKTAIQTNGGVYTLNYPSLVSGNTYFIEAFIDCLSPVTTGYAISKTKEEPSGWSSIAVASETVQSNVIFAISDKTAFLDGAYAYYTGTAYEGKPLLMGVQDIERTSEYFWSSSSTILVSGTTQYQFPDITNIIMGRTYKVKAFVDADNDGAYDEGEPFGDILTNYNVMADTVTIGDVAVNDMLTGFITGTLSYNPPIYSDHQVIIGITPLIPTEIDLGNTSNYAKFVTTTTSYPYNYSLNLAGISTTNYTLVAVIVGQGNKVLAKDYSVRSTYTQWTNLAGKNLAMTNQRGKIMGVISYPGSKAGNMYIGAFDSSNSTTPVNTVAVGRTTETSCAYQLDTLDFNTDYWIRAYVDCFIPNGSFDVGRTTDEPTGFYTDTNGSLSPINISSTSIMYSSINVEVKDVIGSISGTIGYNGNFTSGNIYVGAFDLSISSESPCAIVGAGSISAGTTQYAYSIGGLTSGNTFFMKAYLDSVEPFGDMSPSNGEASGQLGGDYPQSVVLINDITAGANFEIRDPEPGSISGMLYYNNPIFAGRQVLIGISSNPITGSPMDPSNYAAYITLTPSPTDYPCSFNLSLTGIPTTNYMLIALIMGQDYKIIAATSTMHTLTQWSKIGEGLSIENKRGILGGTMQYSGLRSGNIHVGAFASAEALTPVSYTVIDVNKISGTAIQYEIDTVDFGMNYWVRAYIDCFIPQGGGYDVGFTSNEPQGVFRDTSGNISPAACSVSVPKMMGVDFPIKDQVGTISGNIIYNGVRSTGTLYVGLWDVAISSQGQGAPQMFINAGMLSTGRSTYSYTFDLVPIGHTYLIQAYVDCDAPFGDLSPTSGEPSGRTTDPVFLSSYQSGTIDFAVIDSAPGYLAGTVNYTGGVYLLQPVTIALGHGKPGPTWGDAGNVVAYSTGISVATNGWPYSFNVPIGTIPDATDYYLAIMIDVNPEQNTGPEAYVDLGPLSLTKYSVHTDLALNMVNVSLPITGSLTYSGSSSMLYKPVKISLGYGEYGTVGYNEVAFTTTIVVSSQEYYFNVHMDSSYYVNAIVDMNSNGMYGDVGDLMQRIGPINNFDLSNNNNIALVGPIAGNGSISYYGNYTGKNMLISAGIRKPGASFTPSTSTIAMSSYGYSYYNFDLPVHTDVLVTAIIDVNNNGIFNPAEGDSYGEIGPIDTTSGSANLPTLYINDQGGYINPNLKYEGIYGDKNIVGMVGYGPYSTGWVPVVMSSQSMVMTEPTGGTQYKRTDFYFNFTLSKNATNYFVVGFVDLNGDLQFQANEPFGQFGPVEVPGSNNYPNVEVMDNLGGTGKINGSINYSGSYTSYQLYVELYSGDPSNILQAQKLAVKKMYPMSYPVSYSFGTLPNSVSYFVRAGIDVTYNGSVDSDEPIGKRGPIAVSATNSPIADIILSTGTLGEGYINGQVYYNGEEFRDKPVFINLWNGLPSLTTSKVIRKTVITPYNWPIYYSFSMVQAYSGYYVTAGIDANNDGVVNAVVEPFIRRDQPITIGSTSETNNVSGIDMTIPYKSATGYSGSISVNYSYNSPSPKQGMYRAYLGHGQPGPNWTPVRIATNTLQYGSFYWAGVPDAEDWAVFIGVDVDNSGQVSPDTEPFGMIYPISVSSGSAQNVYVEVRDPMTMTNAIEGNVYYSGVQSGRTYVEVGKVSDTSYTRYAWIDGSYFSFVSLDGDCTYYIKGYKDSNNDYMRDGTDPSTGYNNEYLVFVPMNGKATQMISMADPVGMESGTVDIKVSYGFKSISQGVVHVQFSKYDSANPAAYFSPISRDASFVSTNTATLNTSLQVGTYKVGAYWDKDNDYMYENFEEPWGDAAQMVTVSTSEVKYMDITLKDPVVSGVEGNVSYTNAPTNFLGQLVIRVVEAQSQSIVNRLKFVPSPTIQLTFPKFYQISNITPNTTYFIVAYHDINMSNSIDPGEPVSKRQVFIAESMVTVNHTIALDTTNIATGGISGKVKYTGTNTMNANVLIYVWENAVGGPTTLGSFVINNFEMGEATYTIYGLADKSNYYVAAFKDMSNDTQQQSYEPSGEALNPITVTGGRVTAGKDITLVDFVSGDSSMQTSTYTINMMIREGEWGMTTGGSSGLSGVSVQIIDTYSDYNSDNDKVIAYGVTGIVKGTGSNLDPYRNIEFSGVVLKISTDTYNPYRYNVRLAKEGYIASGMDVFVDQYSNAVVNRDGYLQKRMYVVSVSSISVDTGTDDGISVKAIISPDGDNVNDRAYIRFTYTNTYQGSQSWQKGGSAKITVDTNRDGIFNAFDWRQIVWQMDPANPTGPQVPYKDGVKMTYEDLNRMQAGFDWAMDTWIDQDQFMLGASTQMADSVRKEIMWEGRNTQGQSMPAGVYPVKIELDSPNWDPSDGMVLSDTTTLSIEIKSAGISGYVKYDVKGTTDTADDLPVEGARVSAGGAGCWGEAYTDTNGFYTVGGLKATTATEKAWASVQAKGYTSSEVEDITITADTITPDINFSLQKGATVKGQIVLPAAVDSWYDQFGNRRNGISGTVTASKRGSYSSNFTGFYLQNQVTTYYEITLSPGDYEIYAHAEGEMYTSKRTTLTITSSDVELNINLVPAIKVMGYVKLPATSEGNNYINVGGQRKDGQVSVNGWGNIMPGNTTGYFQVYGVVADPTPGKADSTDDNTYSIRVQVSGYAEKTFDLIIGTESMTIPDMVEVEKGGMMIGKVFADWTPELYEAYKGQKLVMHGRVSSADTGFLQQSSNEGPGAMYIEPATFTVRLILMGEDSLKYLDMVNTSTTIPQGMSLSDYEMIKLMNEYSYAISGMANGKYKLEIWTDIIFNAEPKYVEAVVNGTTTVIMQTITLKQFSGKIQGVVTASTGTVDYSKVRVMAYMPYWEEKGIKARMAEVSTTGYFSIDGLGLGEYIVVANEYSVPPSTTNPKGELSGNFGTVLSRINVPSEDTLSLVLPTGGKISGAVSIKSSKYTAANLVNQKVYAVPLLAERTGTKVTPFETVITSSDGVYAISGLKEEVYRVFIDPDIDVTNDSGTMKTPDVAMIPQMVSLAAGEQKTGINFVLTDGHKITGSVQRPVAGTAESFIVTLFLASTNEEVAFKRLDFTGTNTSARTLPFEFANITSGKYVIRIKSTDISYKIETRQIEIPLIDLTIFQPLSLTMSPIIVAKGATVKGTVLDAVTGSSVGNSNVRVHIEARPWVDGSSRDTGTGSGDVQISTGMFTFKNLPGGTYILDIQTRVGSDGKVNGKNYIAYFKAGIVVPNEAIEVDVGSVKLKEGVTITGKVVDMSAKPLANIKIMAKPSEKMGESIDLIATTNEFGEYTINSINPDVKYWDVTAGIRDSGDTSVSRYGAVTMRSVIQGSKDVNFKLEEAPGILRGLIKIEEGYRMITPVSGYEIPGALVLLQKKGVEYKNPMDGIETASKPPKDVEEYSVVHQEAEFEVKGLVPGEYIIKVFVKGLATATKDITVVGGINNLTEAIELKGGGTVLGGISKTNGSKITTNDATMAVAVSEDFTKMVFGYFTVNQTTLEIDSYTITGLEPSVKYFIALSQTNGEVFVAPGQVMVNSARAVVSKNLTYQPHPLKFKVKAFRKQRGRNISFTLTILASAPLVEGDPTKLDTLKEIVTLSSPTVQEAIDAFDVISMSLDKQMLVCTYLPGDETEFSIRTKGTDAEGNTGDETSTFPIDIKSKNEEKFNPISGGEVKVGEGNTSGMYIPAGTFNSTGTVTAEVIVESTITNTGSAAIAKAYMAASNLPGVQASEVYNMQVKIVNGPLAKLASGKTVKVTIQYSTLTVTNTDLAKLYVYQLNSDGSWSKVTNGMNIDTVSNTISVESGANSSGNVSGKFAAFIGSAQTSGGDGSGTYAGPFKTYVYPNPFKPATDTNANIRYFIPAGETNLEVTIKIFNIAGELVREFDKVTLVATGANNGYTATWDGTNQKSEKVASGVYIYKFKAGTHTDTKRIAVIR